MMPFCRSLFAFVATTWTLLSAFAVANAEVVLEETAEEFNTRFTSLLETLFEDQGDTTAFYFAVYDPDYGRDYYWALGNSSSLVPFSDVADVPATLQDTINIGSISKSFAGTVHLRLIEEGIYSLEDTVVELVPDLAFDFPEIANYTVFELLGMRTSIPDFANEQDSLFVTFIEDTVARFTKREIIAFAMQFYPKVRNEEYTYYSTTNVLIMEIIAETITGRDMADLLQEYVFDPLNMPTARLLPFDATAQDFFSPPPAATSYTNAECLEEFPPNATKLGADLTDIEATVASTRSGGAMQLKLDEMLVWAKSGTGDTLLSNKTVQARHDARTSFSLFDPRSYGLYQYEWKENNFDVYKNAAGLYGHDGQTLGTVANTYRHHGDGFAVAGALNSCAGDLVYKAIGLFRDEFDARRATEAFTTFPTEAPMEAQPTSPTEAQSLGTSDGTAKSLLSAVVVGMMASIVMLW